MQNLKTIDFDLFIFGRLLRVVSKECAPVKTEKIRKGFHSEEALVKNRNLHEND